MYFIRGDEKSFATLNFDRSIRIARQVMINHFWRLDKGIKSRIEQGKTKPEMLEKLYRGKFETDFIDGEYCLDHSTWLNMFVTVQEVKIQ